MARQRYSVVPHGGMFDVRDEEGRLCFMASTEERADAVASFLISQRPGSPIHPGTRHWIAAHVEAGPLGTINAPPAKGRDDMRSTDMGGATT